MSDPGLSERAERSRRAIFDAACQIFHERGYAGASLNEIIKASGLTKGGFYFHYPSKEALAIAVVRESFAGWAQTALEEAQAQPRAIDRLFAIPRAIAALDAREHGLWSQRRLVDELSREPGLRAEVVAPIREQVGLAATLIRAAQAEGDVRPDVDPDAVAELAVGSFLGLGALSDELADEGFERRVETLIATLRAAIASPPSA